MAFDLVAVGQGGREPGGDLGHESNMEIRSLRREMGRRARQVVVEQYSHDANYPKMKAVLEAVTTPPPSTGP